MTWKNNTTRIQKTMKHSIYLDDVRTPIPGDVDWIVVRSYDEFVSKVTEIGLDNIDLISLDHDLGDSAMKEWHTNAVVCTEWWKEWGSEG